jgi:hypothetical protein
MKMHVLARTDRGRGYADGLAVLNYRAPGGNIGQSYFVSTWNRLTSNHISLAECLTRRDV